MSEFSDEWAPPEHFNEKQKAVWDGYSRKYGVPIYKYPFWFWDNSEPHGPKEDRQYAGPFTGWNPTTIHACAVWRGSDIEDLPFFSHCPPYLEDHSALSLDDPTVEVIEPPEEGPTSVEEVPAQKEKAEVKATTNKHQALLYTVVGFIGTAILVKKYQQKKKHN